MPSGSASAGIGHGGECHRGLKAALADTRRGLFHQRLCLLHFDRRLGQRRLATFRRQRDARRFLLGRRGLLRHGLRRRIHATHGRSGLGHAGRDRCGLERNGRFGAQRRGLGRRIDTAHRLQGSGTHGCRRLRRRRNERLAGHGGHRRRERRVSRRRNFGRLLLGRIHRRIRRGGLSRKVNAHGLTLGGRLFRLRRERDADGFRFGRVFRGL